MWRTYVATGITARECIAAKRADRASDVMCGLADAFLNPDPILNTSQHRKKMFHSSMDTLMLIVGRSNFGPRAGARDDGFCKLVVCPMV